MDFFFDTVLPALPGANAILNGISAVLLLLGFQAIRRRDRDRHRVLMGAAAGVSGLFLISYVTKTVFSGTTVYGGTGLLRILYLFILGTHLTLAMALVPLVGFTLYYAFTNKFRQHRRWAKYTLPIWLYVSMTGVMVFLLLRPWY